MARFNHAYTVAFEVKTDHSSRHVTPAELLAGMEARVAYLRSHPQELREACGAPYDSMDEDEDLLGDGDDDVEPELG